MRSFSRVQKRFSGKSPAQSPGCVVVSWNNSWRIFVSPGLVILMNHWTIFLLSCLTLCSCFFVFLVYSFLLSCHNERNEKNSEVDEFRLVGWHARLCALTRLELAQILWEQKGDVFFCIKLHPFFSSKTASLRLCIFAPFFYEQGERSLPRENKQIGNGEILEENCEAFLSRGSLRYLWTNQGILRTSVVI